MVDFMRGPAEIAEAISEKRRCQLSAHLGAHIVEIVEALQYPERFGYHNKITTSFSSMRPLPWK